MLGIQHDKSLPGEPRNNAMIERTNRLVVEGAMTLLHRAGLPVQFWPFACRYFCLCHNALAWKGRKSAHKQAIAHPGAGWLLIIFQFGLVSCAKKPPKSGPTKSPVEPAATKRADARIL